MTTKHNASDNLRMIKNGIATLAELSAHGNTTMHQAANFIAMTLHEEARKLEAAIAA